MVQGAQLIAMDSKTAVAIHVEDKYHVSILQGTTHREEEEKGSDFISVPEVILKQIHSRCICLLLYLNCGSDGITGIL
jgi:hypothetical protein